MNSNPPIPPRLADWLVSAASDVATQVALESAEGSLTYGDLASRVRQLAAELRSAGVGRGDRLAIAATRSPETIVAILAAVDVGAAYVPLDAAYPPERLRAMIAEAAPRAVIGEPAAIDQLRQLVGPVPTLRNIAPRHEPPFAAGSDLAYVLFTSGSTGRPKGVAMGELPLRHLIQWHARHERLGQPARALQFAPLSFDVHFQEIFSTLACRGTLVLIPEAERRDPDRLRQALVDRAVERIFVPYVALQMIADASRQHPPPALRDVISAGEQLQVTPVIREFFRQLPAAELHNHYGPTESHVVTAHELRGDAGQWPDIPPIGKPLPHVRVVLAGGNSSDEGELLLGGETLAAGYIGQEALTHERFREDVFDQPGRWYVTGDLVRRDERGVYTYLGRADQQVKVDGFRIEPGEIELALMAEPGVKDAVVTAPEVPGGGRQLVAYLVVSDAPSTQEIANRLRVALRARLPEYMVPVRYMVLDRLPTTPSGKIDRKALPLPKAPDHVGDTADAASLVRATWCDLLGLGELGDDQNLFELGARSLLVLRFIARMRDAGQTNITVADVYDKPTVGGIVSALSGQKASLQRYDRQRASTAGIAIVGMASRTPGSPDVDAFWENLLAGKEGIRHFAPEEVDPSIPESIRTRPNFIAARGVLEDVDRFDAAFFGISGREATLLDPQQRLLLELSWNALESAGVDPSRTQIRIGAYLGTGNNTYAPALRANQPELITQSGEFALMLASEKDYAATRVAHRLDLRGPAVSVHTACSTGLVAVAEAWHALASGRCDVAIAGGASVVVPQNGGYLHIEGAMESADGHCRPFDEAATGTVFASGGAVVALKRLEDAQRDGDTIYAVIQGVGLNNDGGDKASFTAPSVTGQAMAIRMALDHAGVSARDIGYVEAHGTATTLGDPIEVAALTRAWREDTPDTQFCGIGSLKGNLGHMVAAAGVAGLIKVALCLHREQIPGTLHYRKPNPQIDFASTPFRVVAASEPWPRAEKPRHGAVSSFGVGGTNAHVVLREAPPQTDGEVPSGNAPMLFPISAYDHDALLRRASDLAACLSGRENIALDGVVATLIRGRKAMRRRAAVVADSPSALIAQLQTLKVSVEAATTPRIVFLFPGQGSQHPGMGRQMYAAFPAYREALDQCLAAMPGVLSGDIRRWLLDCAPDDRQAAATLAETRHAQPAIFAVSYAIAAWLDSLGIRPDAMIGHSIGEYAAACVAGVMGVEDAVRAVVARGQAMQEQPPGAMLAVRESEANVRELLPRDVEVAAYNAPALVVVAGDAAAIDSAAATLDARGIGTSRLTVSHAFHSRSMEPALPHVEAALRKSALHGPRIQMYSCVSGEPLKADEAISPAYWARQVRAPVRFSKAVQAELEAGEGAIFVEVGSSRALTALLRQYRSPADVAPRVVPVLGPARDPGDAARNALLALGGLWSLGVEVAWPIAANAARLPLPGYPFGGERYWFARKAIANVKSFSPGDAPAAPAIEVEGTMSRIPQIRAELVRLVGEVSGLPAEDIDAETSFTDQGLDSLSFTQAALELEHVFGVKIRFRRLMEDLGNVAALAEFLDTQLPPDRFSPPAAAVVPPVAPALAPVAMAMPSVSAAASEAPASALQQLIQQQMQLMTQQLALLGGASLSHAVAPTRAVATPAVAATPPPEVPSGSSPQNLIEKPFGASARITLDVQQQMTAAQRTWLADFTVRYNARTRRSKEFSQQNRGVMSDPRVVTGFNPQWKDLVYPIVADQSSGARVRDIDGNEYIDVLACFGANLLGYQPPTVVEAIARQLQLGLEVGPQHPLAADVARLVSEFTGMERVAFCNTGSEAVMGAMRIARTVTGRKTIAIFTNSYHGIFDEVIVRGTRQLKSLSAAPGILASAVENVLVLDYGSDESLRVLRERGRELAAIMIEPIQNKYPTLQPTGFVHDLRRIADESGCALIFDEVVTGFRVAAGGAQEFYGVRADIATYGKVIGGGLPFAVIAGRPQWLDALDGGHWQYGDDSYPEAGVTYFAGTFVRHPLALAAAHAVLLHLKKGGKQFYETLNERTQRLADALNAAFLARNAPVKAVNCASLWRLAWDEDQKYVSLFYYLLRFKGIHVYEQFGHFVTEGFSETDLEDVARIYVEALDELMAVGFIRPRTGGGGGGGLEPSNPASRPVTPVQVAVPREGALAPGQTERWLAASYDPAAASALNESFCLTLEGAVDLEALRTATLDVMERHDAFRIGFSLEEPLQRVARQDSLRLENLDLRSERNPDAALAEFCRRASRRAFDIQHPPLMAVTMLRLAPQRTVVHVVASHLVFDGWAASVFVSELATAYTARAAGKEPVFATAESPLQFAAALNERFQSDAGKADMAYWAEVLRGAPPPLMLGDLQPPARREYSGSSVQTAFTGTAHDSIRSSVRGSGATLFQWLLAAVTVAIRRLSGKEEFVVSVPFAAQSLSRHGPLLSDGVLDLPLRLHCRAIESAAAVLARVRGQLMDAMEHPLVTQGAVARELRLESKGDRPPFSSVFFNLNPRVEIKGFSPLAASMREAPKGGSLPDLFFNFYDHGDAIALDLHYSAELFSEDRAQRIVAALKAAIVGLSASMDGPVGSGDEPPRGDPRLWQWNSTAVPLTGEMRIEARIAEQAAKTPNAIAICTSDRELTYREMESRANRIANVLRGRGCGPGDLVGVCLARGPDLVPALLGILKTGAAYVPLDPGFPVDRLAYMAKDAQVRLVITESVCAARSGVARAMQLRVDDDAAVIQSSSDADLPRPANHADAAAPAYVIYTSGSTGLPKGVVVRQRSVCNFLASMRREPGLSQTDTLLAVTTLSFDIAVLELFLPLLCGARIVLAQREQAMDPEELKRLIVQHRVSVMQATPTTWHMLIDADWRAPSAFRVLCGGEPLPPVLADRLLEQGVELWNMYGPTETTVWSTVAKVRAGRDRISIGHPIDNTQVWVLDEHNVPCAPGEAGEICIGGEGVAAGYFNRAELTAEKFLTDPFSKVPGAMLYRTGDRGRWLDTGELEHLGRLDFQVKIRGYRIELGEIETRIGRYPGIARVVVTAREDVPGDVALVGYVVPESQAKVDVAALRESLRATLPDYMLPRHVVVLDTMPLLPNDKIDRKALPAPTGISAAPSGRAPSGPVGQTASAPVTELQRRVAESMAAVLGLPEVSAEQNFFELGGHSLLAARLATNLISVAGRRPSLREIFEAPTPAALAAALADQDAAANQPLEAPSIPVRSDQSTAPLSQMQQRLWFLENLNPGTVVHNIPSAHRLSGPLDGAALDQAFRLLVDRQSVLRTVIERSADGGRQRVLGRLNYTLPVDDLSALDESARKTEMAARIKRLVDTPYDLENGPLFTAHLYRLSAKEHVLFFQAHHLIWDGWSFDILYTDLSELYASCLEERQARLPAVTVTYGDFAAWHNQWMSGSELARQTQFWLNKLSPPPPPLDLPLDRERPSRMSGRGDYLQFNLPGDIVQALRSQARMNGRTLYATLLAVYALALHQQTNQRDFAIGTPVRGREQAALEPLMGFFVNMLPMRMRIDPDAKFDDWVATVQAMVAESFSSPDVPFDHLVRELKLPRDESRSLIYQVSFSYQDARNRSTRWANVEHQRVATPILGAAQDIGLWCVDAEGHMEFVFTFNADILDAESVRGFARRIEELMCHVVANPQLPLSAYSAVEKPAVQFAVPSGYISESGSVTSSGNDFPATKQEQAVAEIWCELLGVQHVRRTDNFFDLGGHSLLAMRAISKMEERLGVRVNVRSLIFDTLAQIASLLTDERCQSGETQRLASSVVTPSGGVLQRLLGGLFGRGN